MRSLERSSSAWALAFLLALFLAVLTMPAPAEEPQTSTGQSVPKSTPTPETSSQRKAASLETWIDFGRELQSLSNGLGIQSAQAEKHETSLQSTATESSKQSAQVSSKLDSSVQASQAATTAAVDVSNTTSSLTQSSAQYTRAVDKTENDLKSENSRLKTENTILKVGIVGTVAYIILHGIGVLK